MPPAARAAELAASAFSLFSSRGIAGVTMDAIAAEADVTKGSLYWHYESKDEVVQAACRHYYQEWHRMAQRKIARKGCDLKVFFRDLDRRLFKLRHDINGCETRLSLALRIERTHTSEAMSPPFTPEHAERERPFHMKRQIVDPDFSAIGLAEFFDFEAMLLEVEQIHAHQHLCPVIGFGTAVTRRDTEVAISMVVFPAE